MKAKRAVFVLAVVLSWGCRGVEPLTPKIKLDPESEKFYETARLIMSKEETRIFAGLQDAASRKEFIEDFWEKRNPDPGASVNEFKRDFLARVEYANKRFKEGARGVNTDRGRVYLFLGPPDKFEEIQDSGDAEIRGGILYWIYYKYDLLIVFADQTGLGHYKIQRTEGDFFGAMEWVKMGYVAAKDENNKAKFMDFNLRYDPEKKEILVALPLKFIRFKDDSSGSSAELNFAFYIYETNGRKVDRFQKIQQVKKPDSTNVKTVTVAIPYDLKSGKYYVDTVVLGKDETLTKARKIFEIEF